MFFFLFYAVVLAYSVQFKDVKLQVTFYGLCFSLKLQNYVLHVLSWYFFTLLSVKFRGKKLSHRYQRISWSRKVFCLIYLDLVWNGRLLWNSVFFRINDKINKCNLFYRQKIQKQTFHIITSMKVERGLVQLHPCFVEHLFSTFQPNHKQIFYYYRPRIKDQ